MFGSSGRNYQFCSTIQHKTLGEAILFSTMAVLLYIYIVEIFLCEFMIIYAYVLVLILH